MANTPQDNQAVLLLDAVGTETRKECQRGLVCLGRFESNRRGLFASEMSMYSHGMFNLPRDHPGRDPRPGPASV